MRDTAIDYETYYDAHYSTQGQHPYTYCQDPLFDAYLVAITNKDFRWVGHPKDAPWDEIKDDRFIAHNMGFDYEVHARLIELGIIPSSAAKEWPDWRCTADMSRYFQGPRSLGGALYAFLNRTRSKAIRDDYMKGKHWADIVADGMDQQVMDYALEDTDDTFEIWEAKSGDWPEQEQMLSVLGRWMGSRGPYVDLPLLEQGLQTLERIQFDAENALPWINDINPKSKKPYAPGSVKGLAVTCQRHNIPPPENTRKDSPELEEWLIKYGKQYDWVANMGRNRQATKHLATLRTLRSRHRADGTIPYGLKYGGADTTLRYSGDNGFNTQNMPRKPMFGVDIRNIFIPRPGKVFIDCDLSQIEPRCLAYGSGDTETLRLLAGGMSPYEVHARKSMGFRESGTLKAYDGNLYNLAKARVLSLGYGASWLTFIGQARTYGAEHIFNDPIYEYDIERFYAYVSKWAKPEVQDKVNMFTPDELQTAVNAWLQVCDYRKNNPLVRDFWNLYGNALAEGCSKQNGSELNIGLPSGRVMRYMHLRRQGDDITGFTQIPDGPNYKRRRKLYGAMLVENYCQGMGRDVFCEYLYKIGCVMGMDVVFQIHDQVLVEVPRTKADYWRDRIEQVMSEPMPWAPYLPVAAEADITFKFQKG